MKLNIIKTLMWKQNLKIITRRRKLRKMATVAANRGRPRGLIFSTILIYSNLNATRKIWRFMLMSGAREHWRGDWARVQKSFFDHNSPGSLQQIQAPEPVSSSLFEIFLITGNKLFPGLNSTIGKQKLSQN